MSIKMKALRSFGVAGANEGKVKRGREFDAHDGNRARELEAHGLAYPVAVKSEPPLQNKMLPAAPSNKAAEAGPLDSVGGAIGAAAPAPSSAPARAPRRRRSSSSADDSES